MERVRYAIVREDPAVEVEVVQKFGASAMLVVAGGGCTALTLSKRFPAMMITAFDSSAEQLAHLEAKGEAAFRNEAAALNVGDDSPEGLNQRGAFDGMYRLVRRAIEEYVAKPADLATFFRRETKNVIRLDLCESWIASPYWPIAFEMAFAPRLLGQLLGPTPSGHAKWAEQIRKRFEDALRADGASSNPFLQHALLGKYLEPPDYMGLPEVPLFETIKGGLTDVPDLERFDVISLSGLLHGLDERTLRAWTSALSRACVPGAPLVYRQFASGKNMRSYLEPWFSFDDDLGATFSAKDRGLFYDRVEVAFRSEAEPPAGAKRPASWSRLKSA